MKMQESGSADQQVAPSMPARSKRNRWLAGIGAIIVIILLVGLSILIFAQLRQKRAAQTSRIPPTAHWKQVLKGYTLISLNVGSSDPAIIYACTIRETPNESPQASTSPITILRSSDFGDHWQNIGGSVIAGDTCQLAVNSRTVMIFMLSVMEILRQTLYS